MSMAITIKAEHVYFDEMKGTAEIVIPSRTLTDLEHKVLNDLFPDLESAVGMLLAKQALMGAICR